MKAKFLITILILCGLFSTATVRLIYACGNQSPVAVLTVIPEYTVTGAEVTLLAYGSYDPDGTITKHEWDVNYDGSTFSPEYTETSRPNTPIPLQVIIQ